MKIKEIREMQANELKVKVADLEREMNVERAGKSSAGGRVQNPGKLRMLRRTLAQVLTVMCEKEKGVLK